MVIGLSGKINSGKDLGGLMIQYRTSDYNKHYSFLDWEERVLKYNSSPNSRFITKKFADKLKDMVCLMLGCTRKQLEDRGFKDIPLGPDWIVWYGRNYKLSNNRNTRGQVTDIFMSKKEVEDHVYISNGLIQLTEIISEELTPRKLMQLLGTDCGRKIIHPNIWVNSLMSDYKGTEQPGLPNGLDVRTPTITYPDWIITDVRFPNEVEAIHKKGGIVIRIDRPYSTVAGQGNPATFDPIQFHPSETALDHYAGFDYVINNDGSKEDLLEKLKAVKYE